MIFLIEDLFLGLDEQADDHQSCHLQCRVYRCGVYVHVQSKVYSVECACYH